VRPHLPLKILLVLVHCLDVFVRHLSFSRCKGTICYTKKRKKFIIQGNFVSLVSPKILSLEKKQKKNVFSFCFSLIYSYLFALREGTSVQKNSN
jgi:hypothetical protein